MIDATIFLVLFLNPPQKKSSHMSLINFNPKVAASLIIGVAIGALAAHKIPESKAQSSALSGKFGCVINSNATGFLQATGIGNAFTNTLGIFDFDLRTAVGISSVVDNFNQGAAALSNFNESSSIAVNAGPFAGSYTVTTSGGAIYSLVPVNSSNTMLVSKANTGPGTLPETGVCQKI
jgi:hypothetical protein